MSHLRSVAAPCVMRFSSQKAAWAVGFLFALVGGCGLKLEVLEGKGATGGTTAEAGAPNSAGDASAGASAAGTGGGGGAGARGAGEGGSGGAEGESLCDGSISPEVLTALTMGEACTDKDICEPDACASIGMSPDSNTAAFVACRNQQVQIVTMTLLDVAASEGPSVREGAVNWDDCESALAGGTSGDTCTWLSQSCIRHTDDPCCLEGAQCLSYPFLTPPEGLLHRSRLCAPGCTVASPDSTAPIVTDCETAAAADTCHETARCEGDFICYRSLAETTLGEYTETSQVNGAMWCAGNVLVGGYGLTWGF